METIEATIKEHNKTDKNGSSSNESNDSAKRRRNTIGAPDANADNYGDDGGDDDFIRSTTKRTVKRQNLDNEVYCSKETENYSYNQCLPDDDDDEMEFDDFDYDKLKRHEIRAEGRVLPSWSTT